MKILCLRCQLKLKSSIYYERWMGKSRDSIMKKFCYRSVLLAWLGLVSWAGAQTTDPARIEDLKMRFQQGVRLDNEGKLKEAREIFLGIIKDEPNAPGSLFYAAFTSLRMGEPEKAVEYIQRFRTVVPKDFKGIVIAIQANQALRRSVKVEALRKELLDLRASANIAGLTDSKSFRREFIIGEAGAMTVVMEFFDYKMEPYYLYQAEQFSAEGDLLRRLTVFYNPDETKITQSKNAKFSTVEIFNFSEDVIKDDKAVQLNVYRQEFEKPSYDTARKWFLEAIKSPPKPIQTVPLN
jgi:tetratricopeptide (TPR) repeat protein